MDRGFETALVREYIEGQPEAYRRIAGWIQMVVGNRNWGLYHQREDIFQEVHKRLFENLTEGRFRGSSSLKTYVVQIARYTCIEFLRAKIRAAGQGNVDVTAIQLPDGAPSPEEILASAEKRKRAAQAMARLPESCRELFHLIFIERRSYQAISEQLGIAEGTVKSRAWRCREMLVKQLGEAVLKGPAQSTVE